MALFGFNSHRYEMLMSVFIVYATQYTASCVAMAILIGTFQLVNDIRARRGNACVRICSVTQQSSRAELHFRHRMPYSFGWIASPATRDGLSWHWISWRLLPLKPMLNDYSRCVVIWQQENGKVRCPCVGGYFWNWTVTFCINSCTVNWTVTCLWYCRTAEDTLQRLRFLLLLTYLLSVVISRTTLTYKNVKTKTKMPPKLKLKLKWHLKLKKHCCLRTVPVHDLHQGGCFFHGR